jgi:cystathionine beta-lyase/cystathionine gamma-synthase
MDLTTHNTHKTTMSYSLHTPFSKDPYRRQGTAYLHIRDDRSADEARLENPTGAVVVPISLATTFEQKVPGLATAVGDPNSFGKGYEYSRTGKNKLPQVHYHPSQ